MQVPFVSKLKLSHHCLSRCHLPLISDFLLLLPRYFCPQDSEGYWHQRHGCLGLLVPASPGFSGHSLPATGTKPTQHCPPSHQVVTICCSQLTTFCLFVSMFGSCLMPQCVWVCRHGSWPFVCRETLTHMPPLSLSPSSSERPALLSPHILRQMDQFLQDIAM